MYDFPCPDNLNQTNNTRSLHQRMGIKQGDDSKVNKMTSVIHFNVFLR